MDTVMHPDYQKLPPGGGGNHSEPRKTRGEQRNVDMSVGRVSQQRKREDRV